MEIGDEITIEPLELVAGGDAIARVDRFPVFASNIYPGDIARVRVTEVKKGFARAELVSIESPSSLRRAAPCPIAEECGGCDWTALRLDVQLEAKRRILTESLRRIGKFDVSKLPPIAIHPSPLNYRLRSRLHRDGDAIGFYAMQSHRVVPLSRECEVVGVETARAFGETHAPHPAFSRSLPEGEGIESLHHPLPPGEGAAKRRVRGVPLAQTEADALEIWEVESPIHGYHVTHDAFFQVNRHLLGTMLRLVSEIAAETTAKGTAVDLYSGVGFFSRPLAHVFEQVTAVEGSPASHECAKRNAARNVKLVHAPVERWIDDMPRTDFVFLDPPRIGARRNVIDAIAQKATERICFLACDPVTFARDASRLTASGWRIRTLDLLDLFPNTHHVETLSSFERAP
jgi:23S rRNA (uracil1939-C5)-methyltransferase